MKYSKLRMVGVLVCLLPAAAWVGCGGDDSTTDPVVEDPGGITDGEAEVAGQMTMMTSILYQIGTVSNVAAQETMVAVNGGRSGLTGECPAAQVNSFSVNELQMDLDYGDGCTSEYGYSASGKLEIALYVSSVKDSVAVTFDAFQVEGYSLDGDLGVVGKGTEWVYSFTGVVGGLYSLDMEYGVSLDGNGTPTNPSDDTATISGAGSVSLGPLYVALDIDESLVFETTCAHPTDGVLVYTMTTTDGSQVTQVDYGTGDCCTADATTTGDRNGTVDLCEP